ncbi:DUF5658 family protein [Oceanirhabdus sp. W0125-5]|uniref:DUF5658 family protein n=1 Tax=Oceanirhabdus sp. W0125-5 TaxID=2999116 RepID=UPI0022F31E7A|nr:DUF5658 family protein [Oceanirhabdus sp. W0125-5]WBW95168.1 DUF5658 family protein [Oceanirhabdus sp. W0125-5]
MISFIRNHNIYNIKKKFLLLYILNLSDIIFTHILLDSGLFIEANPLMSGIVQNSSAGILFKVFLPAILFLFIYKRMQNATINQLYYSNILINIILTFYVVINISHLFWILSILIFIRL